MSATALTGREQRIVDVFVGSLVQKPASFDRTIDDDDEMYLYTLEFGVRGNRAWATLGYLHAGNQMMDALRRILVYALTRCAILRISFERHHQNAEKEYRHKSLPLRLFP